MGFQPEVLILGETNSDTPYYWQMTSDLTWTGTFGQQKGVLTAKGSEQEPFITDLASVPRFLTWLFPRYGTYTKAAVLHDYLCQTIGTEKVRCIPTLENPNQTEITLHDRSDADEVFRDAMGELGVPGARRWFMWGAVVWATLGRSLWYGRNSKQNLRVIGLLMAVAAIAGGGWLFFKWHADIVARAFVVYTVVAAGVLAAGYVAQGRWDRAPKYLFNLVLTVLFAPFLAVGLLALLTTVLYMIIEGFISKFRPTKQRLDARRRSTGTGPAPAKQRVHALKSS